MNITANMGEGSALTATMGKIYSWDDNELTNGDMEAWTGDVPDDWTVTENGSGTVSSSVTNNGGSYSADLYTPVGAGNTVSIKQDSTGTTGETYKISFDVRCGTSGRTIAIKSFDPIGTTGTVNRSYSIVLANTWYTATYEFTWGANDNAVYIATNANGHYYVDNVKLELRTSPSDLTVNMG